MLATIQAVGLAIIANVTSDGRFVSANLGWRAGLFNLLDLA